MKYIFTAVTGLIFIGIVGISLNLSDESVKIIDTQTNAEPVATDDSLNEVTEAEYTIDPDDMFVVNEKQLKNIESPLSDREQYWLRIMREEEKLARDVYQTLGDVWGMRIFSTIANSEQTHTDAIKTLLEQYELEYPVTNDTVGVFTDPGMQKLYNDLTAQGSVSLLEALIVGATIEDLDIKDLDEAIAETTNNEIVIVYQNLQKGSRNHMRAFVRQIESNGGTYTPQYISVSDYEAIISSSQERGRI